MIQGYGLDDTFLVYGKQVPLGLTSDPCAAFILPTQMHRHKCMFGEIDAALTLLCFVLVLNQIVCNEATFAPYAVNMLSLHAASQEFAEIACKLTSDHEQYNALGQAAVAITASIYCINQ